MNTQNSNRFEQSFENSRDKQQWQSSQGGIPQNQGSYPHQSQPGMYQPNTQQGYQQSGQQWTQPQGNPGGFPHNQGSYPQQSPSQGNYSQSGQPQRGYSQGSQAYQPPSAQGQPQHSSGHFLGGYPQNEYSQGAQGYHKPGVPSAGQVPQQQVPSVAESMDAASQPYSQSAACNDSGQTSENVAAYQQQPAQVGAASQTPQQTLPGTSEPQSGMPRPLESSQPSIPQANGPDANTQKPKSKKGVAIIIGVAIVVIALIAGGLGWAFWPGGKTETGPSTISPPIDFAAQPIDFNLPEGYTVKYTDPMASYFAIESNDLEKDERALVFYHIEGQKIEEVFVLDKTPFAVAMYNGVAVVNIFGTKEVVSIDLKTGKEKELFDYDAKKHPVTLLGMNEEYIFGRNNLDGDDKHFEVVAITMKGKVDWKAKVPSDTWGKWPQLSWNKQFFRVTHSDEEHGCSLINMKNGKILEDGTKAATECTLYKDKYSIMYNSGEYSLKDKDGKVIETLKKPGYGVTVFDATWKQAFDALEKQKDGGKDAGRGFFWVVGKKDTVASPPGQDDVLLNGQPASVLLDMWDCNGLTRTCYGEVRNNETKERTLHGFTMDEPDKFLWSVKTNPRDENVGNYVMFEWFDEEQQKYIIKFVGDSTKSKAADKK
ncbi:MAG: hypothetical protein Q4P66_08840 [Actinomycetaceae bacterium]|nr:hypothetical protein [Actinomycetaceae bacterium]